MDGLYNKVWLARGRMESTQKEWSEVEAGHQIQNSADKGMFFALVSHILRTVINTKT